MKKNEQTPASMPSVPKPIKKEIALFLDTTNLSKLSLVSKEWREIILEDPRRKGLMTNNINSQRLFAGKAPSHYGMGGSAMGVLLGVLFALAVVDKLAGEHEIKNAGDLHALKGIGFGVVFLMVIICGVLGGCYGLAKKRNIENKIEDIQNYKMKIA